MNILYIDDDAEDREIFKEAILDIDPAIICHTANDGHQGLSQLEELIIRPDYIFVDVNMPVMCGKQFLMKIKNTTGFRTIPIIMYSTTGSYEEAKEYVRLGAQEFLRKPASYNGICEALKTIIKKEKTDHI